ncbi:MULTISPECIES: ribosome hibernation-promoting factor, HPF/YfiA family [unclassified Tenacibaculum]|uniref:ribosome hibernation-promoting factor, HPF/YfiA family n=1 Tax=unclassified Tenacibaculum TaxID=2635139 RepID=UPI001F1646F8|nr:MULTISPECIES: ribosome-associated translation inhibitor RaiA [unclassified Tenacibaculum]MCF2873162.1 ribosome-associated translation inhibitor RaiA [Tenacibaculum sp. Cn5-1]MCF2933318.1 ribosome-associated translation inhibitor RaiA [Tenacibaculum sp. Cn5-34]MCG7510101.1 ribosome-associated translation inhibitor RaiA [Tenacibaculum sp. Cn5-46]
MEIHIQFVKMPVSENLQEFIQKKLDKLYKKYDWLIKAQVYIKYENDPTSKGKICEMVLSQSGPQIFASSNEDNYQLAVKNTVSDLERQLSKRKQIMKSHL